MQLHATADDAAGSSTWGSTERLQALRNILCIAGGEPSLLETLQPAVQGWLAVAASGSSHGDTFQRQLTLGASISTFELNFPAPKG